jgi:hypothetical protein
VGVFSLAETVMVAVQEDREFMLLEEQGLVVIQVE